MATISFFGAPGTVTGSRFLLEAEGERILIDCGMSQGIREIRQKNWEPFPVEPGSIGAVLLTHAHTDHFAWLPRLVRRRSCKVCGSDSAGEDSAVLHRLSFLLFLLFPGRCQRRFLGQVDQLGHDPHGFVQPPVGTLIGALIFQQLGVFSNPL